jgi:hypothetical protein
MAFALSVDGGMANAYHQRIGLPGVRQGDDGPFPRSLEHAVMQGKVRGGPRFTSFGVRDGLVCHFFTAGTSTATTGAWPSPTTTTRLAAERCRAEGSAIRPARPPARTAVLPSAKTLAVSPARPMTCGVPKFGARPRNQRFAGRTLILAPHTHLRARPRRPSRPRARRSAHRRRCGSAP